MLLQVLEAVTAVASAVEVGRLPSGRHFSCTPRSWLLVVAVVPPEHEAVLEVASVVSVAVVDCVSSGRRSSRPLR